MPWNQEDGPPKVIHARDGSDGRWTLHDSIDQSAGNYAKMLAWLLRSGRLIVGGRGGVSQIDICHEDECSVISKGAPPCGCRPNIRLNGQKWTFAQYEAATARRE